VEIFEFIWAGLTEWAEERPWWVWLPILVSPLLLAALVVWASA
jgi:hypothetical protein